jgi:glycosyltransferase involved in cell wall biosynthesis
MKMRLAWLGPWNEHSAVACFGGFVVSELLSRDHDVTVFRTETGGALQEPPLPTPALVKDLHTMEGHTLNCSFDGVIANVGDDYSLHGSIVRILEDCPCLVIFHDGMLANLAAGWAHVAAAGESSLRALVRRLYGDDVWSDGTASLYQHKMQRGAAVGPMTEWLAPLAAGIVTHSAFWAPRMRAACSGRVDILPLAFPDSDMPPPRKHQERVVVATIGEVGPHDRADQVLLAIASDPDLRAKCEYRSIGRAEDSQRERLERLSVELGLAPPRFTGWLQEAALQAEMAEVDVISCLRYPVLEAGSASLVTAMYAARPILVSSQGGYGEVPGDVLLHCRPGRETADIATHLRNVLANPDAALAIGQRARAYAKRLHSAARYVDRLLPALTAATEAAPAIAAARRLGKVLGQFDIDRNDPAIARIARNLSDMLVL